MTVIFVIENYIFGQTVKEIIKGNLRVKVLFTVLLAFLPKNVISYDESCWADVGQALLGLPKSLLLMAMKLAKEFTKALPNARGPGDRIIKKKKSQRAVGDKN